MGQNTKQRPELDQKFDLNEIPTAKSWIGGQLVYRQVVPLTGGNGTSVSAGGGYLGEIGGDVVSLAAISTNATGFQAGGEISINTTTGVITWTHTGDLTGEDAYAIIEYARS